MTAPITDLMVLVGKDAQAPPNYTKIPYDLNRNARGNFLWLCYKRTLNAIKEECITGLDVLIGKHAEPTPESEYKKIDVDLNRGTHEGRPRSNYIWLVYKKGGGVPIKDIIVLNQGFPPDGYTIIKGRDKDLNRGAGGDTLYLAYLPGEEDTISNWGELPEGIDFELFNKVRENPGAYVQEIARWQSDIDKQIIWTQRLLKSGPWTVQAHQTSVLTEEVYTGTKTEDEEKWEKTLSVDLEASSKVGASAKGVEGEVSRKVDVKVDYGYMHRTTFTKEEYRRITEQVTTEPRDYSYSVAVVQYVNRFELKSVPNTENILATADTRTSLISTFTTGKDGQWADRGTIQAVKPKSL